MEARLRAVQPAIDKDLEQYEKVLIPVYQDIAKRLGLRVDGDKDEPVSKDLKDERLEGEDCEQPADVDQRLM